jgi:hypothetical protein
MGRSAASRRAIPVDFEIFLMTSNPPLEPTIKFEIKIGVSILDSGSAA